MYPLKTTEKLVLSLMLIACFCFPVAILAEEASEESEIETIKKVIEASYIHGAFNELNPEALERGFHPDFAIFSPNGEEIRKFPIADWVQRTRENKAKPDFDPEKNRWHHTFASLDVTGEAASAKIELYKDGKLVFTDYLSLLKFESGWRVVAKVYHRHES